MLNEMINGIAIKLNQTFGDAYSIYMESVEQGLKEPCFFIFLLPSSQDQVIGKRYLRRHQFDIHFFPGTLEKNKEILNVVDKLNDAMEYVTFGSDLMHGTNMHHEVVGWVLHFFVDFNFHVIKASDLDDNEMDSIAVNSTIKG
jgi:hypothetical protein